VVVSGGDIGGGTDAAAAAGMPPWSRLWWKKIRVGKGGYPLRKRGLILFSNKRVKNGHYVYHVMSIDQAKK
jgi:hypothetical protein